MSSKSLMIEGNSSRSGCMFGLLRLEEH